MDDFEVMLRQELGVGDPQELLTPERLRSMRRAREHTAWKFSGQRRHVWYSCCEEKLDEKALADLGIGWTGGAVEGKKGACPLCGAMVRYRCRGRLAAYAADERVHVLYLPTLTEGLAMLVAWDGRRWYRMHGVESTGSADTDSIRGVEEETYVTEVAIIHRTGAPIHWRQKLESITRDRPSYISNGRYKAWDYSYLNDAGGWRPIKSLGCLMAQTLIGYQGQPPATTHTWMLSTALPKGPARYAWQALRGRLTTEALTDDWANLHTCMNLMRSPIAEQAAKAGMWSMLQPEKDWERRVVNLRARDFRRVLPLTTDEWARLRRCGERIRPWMLIVPYWARKLGQPIKLERGMEAVRACIFYQSETGPRETRNGGAEIYKLLADYGERLRLTRMVRYMKRLDYRTIDLWRDTLETVFRLYPECEDTALLFPQDLQRVHDEMHNRLRVADDKKTDEACRRACERLAKKWTFEQDGLRMSPFEDMAEILREGSRQHICIGTYATRYGAGQTILLKLRRADEPEEPWHAVEVTKDGKRLVQCRGERNQTWEDEEQEVRGFWAAFDKARGTDFAQGLALRIKKREEKTV